MLNYKSIFDEIPHEEDRAWKQS